MYDNSLFNSFFIKCFKPGDEEIDKNGDTLKYHYTSPNSFLSIIKSKELYFTDIRYLNDKSEPIFVVKRMVEFVDANHEKYPLTCDAFNDLVKGNNINDIRKLNTNHINYNLNLKYHYNNDRAFVFCTSIDGDSLSMWNYYVNNGFYQGYNIGFNMQKLLKSFDTEDKRHLDSFFVYYGKVLYSKKDQDQEINNLFDVLEHSNFSRLNRFEQIKFKLRSYIDHKGMFYKSDKFSHEKEYRIVLEFSDNRVHKDKTHYFGENNKQIKDDFVIKNGLVVPILKVKLKEDSISRITISPMMEFEIAKDSVRELIDTMGYKNIKIHKSNIPIRY